MSGRSRHPLPPQIMEKPPRGRCISAICFLWKVLTCIVSHVTLVSLVVGYCIGGAFLFRHLEHDHEIKIKQGILNMRRNVTNFIWKMTDESFYLNEQTWTIEVQKRLTTFEEEILTVMKKEGWDGDENIEESQWSFIGALFYSIIVITTIGYGHISPRTEWGKVTTIFYAIVGIPLMLLCLSNIGDVMATSFRFIYWRVCCFVCTREPRRNRRNRTRSRGPPGRYASRSQPPPFRRSMKISPRSADSGFYTYDQSMSHAYSDPELRTMGGKMNYERNFYHNEGQHQHHHHHHHNRHPGYGPPPRDHRGSRQMMYEDEDEDFQEYDQRESMNRNPRFGNRQRNRDRMRDRHTVEREHNIGRSRQQFDSAEDLDLPKHKRAQSVRMMRSANNPREMSRVYSQTLPTNTRGRSMPSNTPKTRAKSVDPRSSAHYENVDEEVVRKTPILCNRYAIDELDRRPSHEHHRRQNNNKRAQSMPRAHKNYNDPQMHAPSTPRTQRRGSLNTPTQSRYGNRLELPEFTPMSRNHSKSQQQQQHHQRRFDEFEEDFDDFDGGYDDLPMEAPSERGRRSRRGRQQQQQLPPSPRIMSPMGFAVRRQHKFRPVYEDDDSFFEEEWDYGNISPKDRPVPIWLCVFLVVSYILAGAFLFHKWEKWSYLDSAYFCFITLTTIGFGDFVPAQDVKVNPHESIALCSLYLLFGISLLAMSFNLVQEEFIANVKEVARRLGILKDEEDDD